MLGPITVATYYPRFSLFWTLETETMGHVPFSLAVLCFWKGLRWINSRLSKSLLCFCHYYLSFLPPRSPYIACPTTDCNFPVDMVLGQGQEQFCCSKEEPGHLLKMRIWNMKIQSRVRLATSKGNYSLRLPR